MPYSHMAAWGVAFLIPVVCCLLLGWKTTLVIYAIGVPVAYVFWKFVFWRIRHMDD